MKLIKDLLALILGMGTATAAAQQIPLHHQKEVVKKGFYISASEFNYVYLANDITAGATTKYEQAQMIYLWLCNNISFDHTGIIRTADEALTNKIAVCQGFCELFYRLAEPLKLDVTLIYGKAKQPIDGRIDEHVWLSISTEKGTILADPTWGSGITHVNSFGKTPEPLIWFDVDPEVFINTHFPKKKKYQFLDKAIKEEEFMSLPYLTPTK